MKQSLTFICLFNDRNVALRTLMSYKSALKDQSLGFYLDLDKRIYSMFVKAAFNKRPPVPKIIPQKSINHSFETIKFKLPNSSN